MQLQRVRGGHPRAAHRPHPLGASQQGRWAPRAAETQHTLVRVARGTLQQRRAVVQHDAHDAA